MITGFIGAGNMGGALAKAAALSNCSDLLISDHDELKAASLAEAVGGRKSDNIEIAETADVIFLGVKPQGLSSLADEIAETLKTRQTKALLVTMAAGITMETVLRIFGECPIIRIMPNTPASIGQGLILYCHKNADEKSIEMFKQLCSPAGLLEPIDESLIDAGCAVSGCGPAFVYMFIESLAEGGIKAGLPKETALKLAAKTVMGAGAMVLESGKDPESLCNAVCSPNGSTIEGVNFLKSTDFSEEIINTVLTSYRRTVELGKGK
ncbi:MAG: pyrroline-5-carboxylate reductase [Ruminococcaceae bacterium]|nr:pyrroline-5-carboxylate reductase [Oscillospiraceae bacterium]